MVNGEEEIGPVPAPPAAPMAHAAGSPPSGPPGQSSRSRVLRLLGVIVIVTALVGGGASLTITENHPTSTTTTTGPTTSTSESTELAYLGRLQPSEGDIPDVREVRLAGRTYPFSLLYEDIGSTPSVAASCESQTSCRATSYELNGRFTRFQATVGRVGTATGASSGESQGQVERWSVLLDGRMVKQGEVMPSSRPDSVDVPLSGALRLELRMIAEPEFEGNIAWGDARVH